MNNRSNILHFKASSPERIAAEALAVRECVKLSEALRMALREAAARRGLWPPVLEPEDQRQKVAA